MTDAIDAALDAPGQPETAFQAACTALLIAIATGYAIGDSDALVLLDSMPDEEMRDGLADGLSAAGLRSTHLSAFRVLR